MFTLRQIEATAEAILAKDPDPIIKVRLLRDVLARPSDDLEYRRAKTAALGSHWLKQLEQAQCKNGSWGRFHTENTKIKSTFPTTEFAISRGVALGIDKTHPIFTKAAGYMVNVLQGKVRWSDNYEKSPCFPLAVKVFTAAKLAMVDPWNTAMDDLRAKWLRILQRAFSDGSYDPALEAAASKDLLGVSTEGSYVGLRSVHNVSFLGCRSERIPKKLQRFYMKWLWSCKHGLMYIGTPLSVLPKRCDHRAVNPWISSLEAVSMFSSWRDFAGRALAWLWNQRGQDGLWDFGPRRGTSPHYPLSQSWRKKGNRQIDYSTRVLALLRRYFT